MWPKLCWCAVKQQTKSTALGRHTSYVGSHYNQSVNYFISLDSWPQTDIYIRIHNHLRLREYLYIEYWILQAHVLFSTRLTKVRNTLQQRWYSWPADDHLLDVAGEWSHSHPDVDREYGTAAVEDRRQRRHQGGHHYGQHEPSGTGRHQLNHQERIGDVRTAGRRSTDCLACLGVGAPDLVWIDWDIIPFGQVPQTYSCMLWMHVKNI